MIDDVQFDYLYILDPVPQQSPEHNKLYPFFDYLREERLTTTHCPDCDRDFWPPRTVCPICHSDYLEWVDLPLVGTVQEFSVQVSGAAPGFNLPLIIARVRLTDQINFVAQIIEIDPAEMAEGMQVQLAVVPAPRNRVLWAFKPAK